MFRRLIGYVTVFGCVLILAIGKLVCATFKWVGLAAKWLFTGNENSEDLPLKRFMNNEPVEPNVIIEEQVANKEIVQQEEQKTKKSKKQTKVKKQTKTDALQTNSGTIASLETPKAGE